MECDSHHCCPADLPVCNKEKGVCTNEAGTDSVPWTSRDKAVALTDEPEEIRKASAEYEASHPGQALPST